VVELPNGIVRVDGMVRSTRRLRLAQQTSLTRWPLQAFTCQCCAHMHHLPYYTHIVHCSVAGLQPQTIARTHLLTL
jgi:hypothetical protein